MIELDGINYEVKTPLENSYDLVNFINNYCSTNNIRNSKGELVFIEINTANPLYLLFLGCGYLGTLIQNLLYSLGRLTSIGSSSERQLLNLAEIALVKRRQPTNTVIAGVVWSALGSDCTITESMTMTYMLGKTELIFHPLFDTVIPANSYGPLQLVCNVPGSYDITAGTLTAFDTPVVGFQRFQHEYTLPGKPLESIPDLRTRMQARDQLNSAVDRCLEALRNLPGVSAANLYFNKTNAPETVQGSVVPARQLLVYIQGYSDDIAKTIANHVNVVVAEYPGTSISQTWTMANGQVFKASWLPPVARNAALIFYVQSLPLPTQIDQIKNAMAAYSLGLNVGTPVDTKQLLDFVSSRVPSIQLRSVRIDGSYKIEPGANELVTFNPNSIEVQQG